MSLSDRIRPNCEAAPWVIEEVKKLEAGLARVTAERDDWKIRAEEMDGYKADCHALRARVAELVAALRQITTDAMDVSPHIETVALNALARAESATPAKHPDTERLEFAFEHDMIVSQRLEFAFEHDMIVSRQIQSWVKTRGQFDAQKNEWDDAARKQGGNQT